MNSDGEYQRKLIAAEGAAALVQSGDWVDYGFGVVECDPDGEHFRWFSWHFSGLDRKWHDAGCCNYVPMNFGEAPDYYRRFVGRVDVACLKTCPMDEQGYFNFGGAV